MVQPASPVLPGTSEHQRVQQAIAEHYAGDRRILAVLSYGSVGRGDWDEYSDLDMAVVIADGIEITAAYELVRLRERLAAGGERVLFAQAAGSDGYLMLDTLLGVSLAYRRLRSIDPYVLDGLRVLAGPLAPEAIRLAALANAEAAPPLEQFVHQALWLAVTADSALHRRRFWRAVHALEPMRGALLAAFASSHGGQRPYHVFEAEASAGLKSHFGRTFPQYAPDSPADSLRSMQAALLALLDLAEHHLDEIAGGRVRLTPELSELLSRIRTRQAALHFD